MRIKSFVIAFVVISLAMGSFLQSASAECCIVYNCTDQLNRHITWRICPTGLPYFCEYDEYKEKCNNAGCIQGMNCMTVLRRCTLYGGPPVRRGGTCDGTLITSERIYYVACQDCLCDDIFNCFFCPDGGIPEESTAYLPCLSSIP